MAAAAALSASGPSTCSGCGASIDLHFSSLVARLLASSMRNLLDSVYGRWRQRREGGRVRNKKGRVKCDARKGIRMSMTMSTSQIGRGPGTPKRTKQGKPKEKRYIWKQQQTVGHIIRQTNQNEIKGGKFWVMKEEDEERREKTYEKWWNNARIDSPNWQNCSNARFKQGVRHSKEDQTKPVGASQRQEKKKILASRFVKETFRKSNKAANFVPDEKQHNGTASVFLLKGMYRQPPTRQPLSILRKLHFQQTLRSTLDHRVHREKLTLKLSLVCKFARHFIRNIRRLPTDLLSVFSNTTNKPHEHTNTKQPQNLTACTMLPSPFLSTRDNNKSEPVWVRARYIPNSSLSFHSRTVVLEEWRKLSECLVQKTRQTHTQKTVNFVSCVLKKQVKGAVRHTCVSYTCRSWASQNVTPNENPNVNNTGDGPKIRQDCVQVDRQG